MRQPRRLGHGDVDHDAEIERASAFSTSAVFAAVLAGLELSIHTARRRSG